MQVQQNGSVLCSLSSLQALAAFVRRNRCAYIFFFFLGGGMANVYNCIPIHIRNLLCHIFLFGKNLELQQ